MESFVVLLLFAVLAVFVAPIALSLLQGARIRKLQATVDKLAQRLLALESKADDSSRPTTSEASAVAPAPAPPRTTSASTIPHTVPPPIPLAPKTAPPLPLFPEPPRPTALPPTPAPPKPALPAIDWEAFMGVKLFAWIGGFVLFLGVVFLVKYSFENNLITPAMRVVVGAVIGLGLVAAGWFTAQRNYRVPGQSLCATGVLVLYADIFGAHTFYNLITLPTAFVLMSVITIAAFLLAVTLDAQVIVVLGLVGGFLTPPLLTSGPDNPLLLFGYVALLNAGIAAVALRKRWDHLFLIAAIGTVLMELSWIPHEPAKASAGFFIFLGLQAQFLAFAFLRQKQTPLEKWSTAAAALPGFTALGFGSWLLSYPSLANRPGFLFGYIFLADLGLLALAMMRPNPARIAGPAGVGVFLILSAWTGWYLRPDLLWWALGAYLLFAIIHSGFSVWPKRAQALPASQAPHRYVPLLALALLFLCVWNGETSFAVWACVLLVDLIAVALALSTVSVVALVVALVATVITAGLWILTAPPIDDSVLGILAVVGGFGIFFSTASIFVTRKLGLGAADQRRNVPALAAAMPFVLLLLLIANLPIPDPTVVFAVALLLAIVLLALGIISRTSWIAAVALAFTWAVERQWDALYFTNSSALLALGWYVAFFILFVAYPFFTGGTRSVASTPAVPPRPGAAAEEQSQLPWAIGALSGFAHFWLITEVITSAYPHLRNGLLPALFVLPYGFGVWYLLKRRRIAPASGDARLAWQGGAALFFISLIFPFQFEREWITLGWALEGLALLWLFRSVPNQGLRLVGTGILCLAFVRLALNPAVFEYHRRAPVRIWNWYLYAYGITTLCLLAGARAVHHFRETTLARAIPRLLYTLGAILTFLLLNIEIADYFSAGPTLTFSFEGNFARDMTYSIAWALFAFALLLIGMRQKTKWVRYAGLALLAVTLAKLLLHDFLTLGPLYRIGAFIGVAIVLIVASFVYQRFLAPTTKAHDSEL